MTLAGCAKPRQGKASPSGGPWANPVSRARCPFHGGEGAAQGAGGTRYSGPRPFRQGLSNRIAATGFIALLSVIKEKAGELANLWTDCQIKAQPSRTGDPQFGVDLTGS